MTDKERRVQQVRLLKHQLQPLLQETRLQYLDLLAQVLKENRRDAQGRAVFRDWDDLRHLRSVYEEIKSATQIVDEAEKFHLYFGD